MTLRRDGVIIVSMDSGASRLCGDAKHTGNLRVVIPTEKQWGTRRGVREVFELPVRKIDLFVREGWVRTVKFGDARQSTRLFRLADVDAALTALATGHEPKRPGRSLRRPARLPRRARDC